MPEILQGKCQTTNVGLCSSRRFLPELPERLTRAGGNEISGYKKMEIQWESPPDRAPEKVSGLWDSCFSHPGSSEGETHVQDLWQISQCDQVIHSLRSGCVTKTERGPSNWRGKRISTEDLQRLLLLQFSYELQITFQNYFSQNTQTPPAHTADLLLKQAPGSARPVISTIRLIRPQRQRPLPKEI